MTYFFDTSALMKYYHPELGSERVIALINDPANTHYVSELIRSEFFSALHRRYRNLEINETELDETLAEFDSSLEQYQFCPLSTDVLREAERLLRNEGRSLPLRTLDSLHLATFGAFGDPTWTFVSTDDQLLAIAEALGPPVLNPLR